jgi:hypothetical protein
LAWQLILLLIVKRQRLIMPLRDTKSGCHKTLLASRAYSTNIREKSSTRLEEAAAVCMRLLKTAKALRLTVLPTLITRAD